VIRAAAMERSRTLVERSGKKWEEGVKERG
jgi:hypothetical protein